MNRTVFWIFGILQSLSLAAIIFLVLSGLPPAPGHATIGLDTRILLSIAFPLFLLIVEYMMYRRS